ncbi:uncharacterized protein LOC144653225 [Oculina patagonica]
MIGVKFECSKPQEVINSACRRLLKRKRPSSGKWQSLEDRLLDCYIESCEGAPKDKRFCHGVRLLEKVVLQDNLSTLVVNLYPRNEGYSLMLKDKNGADSETVRLPYEESEFLDYLDAQELPPILVDLLEKSQANIFYSGCVIVEVRDYRHSPTGNTYDSNYVLLRPTYQTLVCDINAMTRESPHWTEESKLVLESQLLLATEGPLCLDPSIEVAQVANQLQFNKNKFHTPGIRRSIRRHSQAFYNRTGLMSLCNAPSQLKVLDFLSNYKKPQPPVNLRLAKTPQTTDTWRQKPIHLSPPSRVDVDLYSKIIERPKMTIDNTPEKVQEVTLEGEKTNNRNYFCRVTIRRRPTDLQYLGELYLEEDTSNLQGAAAATTTDISESNKAGKACQFFLGSKLGAQKYLQQFQDLYTEEGRKSVKICTYIPGQHQVAMAAAAANQLASQAPNNTTQTSTATVVPVSGNPNIHEQKQAKVAIPLPTATNTVTVIQGNNLAMASHTTLPGNSTVSQVPVVQSCNLSNVRTFGQKLAMFQQRGTVVGTVSSGTGVPLSGTTKISTAGTVTQYISTAQPGTTLHVTNVKPVPASSVTKSVPATGRRVSHPDTTTTLQSPTTPSGGYTGVVGAYMQPVVGPGGMSVTVPAGATVTVAGATPIVPVSNSMAIASGPLPTQFIATGLKSGNQTIQPAPGTPLTLLQGTTAIQTQQAQIVHQTRSPSTTFTIPGNLVPITHIQSAAGAAISAQIQNKTSPQGTPAGQPTPILPNTPLSPPSGMTTVTLNTRPILPQQQQQRKINAGAGTSPTAIAALTSTVNRTTTNLQPLVPIGTQLQQQQFQVRMVQFPQQGGPTQIQCQPTIVQSPRGATPVQIHTQQAQVVQGLQQIQGKPVTTVKVTQQTQGAQTTARAQGRSPAQRRRSQNK